MPIKFGLFCLPLRERERERDRDRDSDRDRELERDRDKERERERKCNSRRRETNKVTEGTPQGKRGIDAPLASCHEQNVAKALGSNATCGHLTVPETPKLLYQPV